MKNIKYVMLSLLLVGFSAQASDDGEYLIKNGKVDTEKYFNIVTYSNTYSIKNSLEDLKHICNGEFYCKAVKEAHNVLYSINEQIKNRPGVDVDGIINNINFYAHPLTYFGYTLYTKESFDDTEQQNEFTNDTIEELFSNFNPGHMRQIPEGDVSRKMSLQERENDVLLNNAPHIVALNAQSTLKTYNKRAATAAITIGLVTAAVVGSKLYSEYTKTK